MDQLGAWITGGGVHFRVWAPQHKHVEVIFEDKNHPSAALDHQEGGYFYGFVPKLTAGALYKFRVDRKTVSPDPCSRYQPQGPHGPSMIVDPRSFKWQDRSWQKKGLKLKGQVIYELHVGTFSPQGNYAGITRELPELKELGVTVLEIMPIAEFPGRWNWGYDGVSLFAPAHVYGTPDELRDLINEAHKLHMAVILDVVYNHLGPDGNYLKTFSQDYFTKKHKTDWGEAINFDGPQSAAVRNFYVRNACYWIDEFHFDGLRLDATQNIYDSGKKHILAEITEAVRREALPKEIIIVAENEPQDINLARPLSRGGYGIDALWNDDFHHSAHVAATGKREAYYTDYLGHPQEFLSMLKRGFLYQGQYYAWQKKVRGTYVDDAIKAEQFIVFLENHDQVANSLDGRRLAESVDSGVHRALTASTLLGPQTPMLFMGQEFASTSPFLFFADHNADLAPSVFKGRKDFLAQFPSLRSSKKFLLDPKDDEAFESSKLDFSQRQTHQHIYLLHKDLLQLRRKDEVFSKQDRTALEGAVLNDQAFAVRYTGKRSDRLLIINLGDDFDFTPCPQPLLAPLPESSWMCIWSSDDVMYGGRGTVECIKDKGWFIPARSAHVFATGDFND